MESCAAPQRVECSPVKNPGMSLLTPPTPQQAPSGGIVLRAVLYGMLALSLAQFIYRVSAQFGTYFSVDMPLFLQTAYDYLAFHVLYVRAEDLQQYYQPGAGVYKYPPLYQLTLVPWFAQGWPEHVYFMLLRISMLLMYLASAGLMIRKITTLQGSALSKTLFYTTAAITTLWFVPFHASHGVVSEIFILFLATLFIYFYNQHTFLSGLFLGTASMLKIYPVFLLLLSVVGRNRKNIAGFIVACIGLMVITMFYFGLDENIFFFCQILPVLLSEKVSPYGSNMNIESYLFAHHVISQEIPVFNIQRVIVLMVLAVVSYRYRNKFTIHIILISSLWICAMLLLLSNYWLQYQLLLLLPIIALLAHGLKTRSFMLLITISLVIISMGIDDAWSDLLFNQAMEQKQLTNEMVIDRVKNNGMLRTAMEISPAAILVMGFSIVKVFVPHMLFVLTAWILLLRGQGEKTNTTMIERI